MAVLFIENTMHDPDSTWNDQTRISSIVPLYGIDDSVDAYSFELEQNGVNNGYIVVSTNPKQKLIQEFAYTAEPVYSEVLNLESTTSEYGLQKFEQERSSDSQKIYYTGGLHYYTSEDDSFSPLFEVENSQKITSYDEFQTQEISNKTEEEIDNSELLNMLDMIKNFNLEEWLVGYSGQHGDSGYGNIYDPITYVQSKYGAGYTMNRQGTISHASIKPHIQQNFEPNFPGVNNCSMSVITTIFEYYRNIGYTNINSSLSGLYSDVRTIGVKYGYTPLDGTSPTKMNNIVNDVWKKYGYSGTGSNQYLYSFDTFTAEIDNRRPAMFNLAYGYYSNHSITVVGYREFKKTEANKARFLKEFDNWTTNDRYVDYNSLTESTVGSVTLIRP